MWDLLGMVVGAVVVIYIFIIWRWGNPDKNIMGVVSVVFFCLLIFTGLHGMYKLAFDDRYTQKEFLVGVFIWPYPMYVSIKELYKIATVPATDRELEDNCLNELKDRGVARGPRLKYCECIVETKSHRVCMQKYK